MRILFIILLTLAISLSANAREVEVTAIGSGADEEWALMNALDNAVRQSSEITIKRDSPMKKIKGSVETKDKTEAKADVKSEGGFWSKAFSGLFGGTSSSEGKEKVDISAEEIDARYKGQILSYSVISSEKKDDKYIVTVKTIVVKPDKYKSELKTATGKDAKYTVAVVPFEFHNSGNMTCGETKFSPNDIVSGITGGLIHNISKTGKFKVVERHNTEAYADEMRLILGDITNPENKNKLKQLSSADYLILGDITDFSISTRTTPSAILGGDDTVSTTAKIHISYRLVDTATMEIIHVSSVDEKMSSKSKYRACKKASDNLLKIVPKQIADDIVRNVFPDYKPKKMNKKEIKKYFRDKEEWEDKCEDSGEDCDDYQPKTVKKKGDTKRPVVKLPYDK